MPLFLYGCGGVGCTYGCNGFLPFSDLDENGNCLSPDWDSLIAKYNAHNTKCSEELFLDDPNYYYGDPNLCTETPCQYGE